MKNHISNKKYNEKFKVVLIENTKKATKKQKKKCNSKQNAIIFLLKVLSNGKFKVNKIALK